MQILKVRDIICLVGQIKSTIYSELNFPWQNMSLFCLINHLEHHPITPPTPPPPPFDFYEMTRYEEKAVEVNLFTRLLASNCLL